MDNFRKNLNLQEINDEIHNMELKEELNKDNALLNTAAKAIKLEQLKDQLREKLIGKEQEPKFSKEYYANKEHDKKEHDKKEVERKNRELELYHKKGEELNKSLTKYMNSPIHHKKKALKFSKIEPEIYHKKKSIKKSIKQTPLGYYDTQNPYGYTYNTSKKEFTNVPRRSKSTMEMGVLPKGYKGKKHNSLF